MILDWRNRGELEKYYERGRCLVNGLEINSAWYIDTDAGVVKTYDAIGDGTIAHLASDFDAEILAYISSIDGVEIDEDTGLISHTLNGKVEVYPPQ